MTNAIRQNQQRLIVRTFAVLVSRNANACAPERAIAFPREALEGRDDWPCLPCELTTKVSVFGMRYEVLLDFQAKLSEPIFTMSKNVTITEGINVYTRAMIDRNYQLVNLNVP